MPKKNQTCLRSRSAEEFARSYLVAALWSTSDGSDESGGEPLDQNYDLGDIAPYSRKALEKQAKQFYCSNERLIESAELKRGGNGHSKAESAGHDLWLTSAGHGSGFWDGDWSEPQATKLTDASKKLGETDLYVGDDKKIYASGFENARAEKIHRKLRTKFGSRR